MPHAGLAIQDRPKLSPAARANLIVIDPTNRHTGAIDHPIIGFCFAVDDDRASCSHAENLSSLAALVDTEHPRTYPESGEHIKKHKSAAPPHDLG